MQKLLLSFLFSLAFTLNPISIQVSYGADLPPCGAPLLPTAECVNPDGSVQNSDTSTVNEDDPSTGNEEDPSTGNEEGRTLTVKNPLKVKNIQDLLAVILSAVVQISIPFLVLALMWVGFLFIAARGNPEKLSKAKQALFFTLLGALIILGAQTLSTVLSGTIEQLTNTPR
jgi:hypothetical protein